MKTKIFILYLCSFSFVGWAFAQAQAPSFDGGYWAQLDKADNFARLMYIKGYLKGYADGDSAMEKIASVFIKKDEISSLDEPRKQLVIAQTWRVAQVLGVQGGNITFGKIESATDAFYSDYRNAPVCWGLGLQFSIMSLRGTPASDDELAAARKAGAQSGCN